MHVLPQMRRWIYVRSWSSFLFFELCRTHSYSSFQLELIGTYSSQFMHTVELELSQAYSGVSQLYLDIFENITDITIELIFGYTDFSCFIFVVSTSLYWKISRPHNIVLSADSSCVINWIDLFFHFKALKSGVTNKNLTIRPELRNLYQLPL